MLLPSYMIDKTKESKPRRYGWEFNEPLLKYEPDVSILLYRLSGSAFRVQRL